MAIFNGKIQCQFLMGMKIKEQIFVKDLKLSVGLRKPKSKRQCNLYLSTCMFGEQIQLWLNLKVYPEQWNKRLYKAYVSDILTKLDNRNNTIVNDKITEYLNNFNEFKSYLCDNPSEISNWKDLIKRFIFKDRIMAKKKEKEKVLKHQHIILTLLQTIENDKRIKSSTKPEYQRRIRKLGIWMSENSIIENWENINYNTINNFQNYLIENAQPTTVRDTINTIIKTIKDAIRNGDAQVNLAESRITEIQVYRGKLDSEQKKERKVVLTEEEVIQLYNFDFVGKEREIVDIFVLQCMMGLRVSDAIELLRGNNQLLTYTDEYGKSYQIYKVGQKKRNRAAAFIPLFPLAKQIIEKYVEGFTYINLANGIASITNTLNDSLKECFNKAALNRSMQYPTENGDKIEVINTTIDKEISTHSGRHTFSSILYNLGADEKDLMIATGHSDKELISKVYIHTTDNNKMKRIVKCIASLKGGKIYNLNGDEQVVMDNQVNEIDKAKAFSPQLDGIQQSIEEAKQVLAMINSIPAYKYIHINDIAEIWGLVREQEMKLYNYNIKRETIKQIYNANNKSFEDKAMALHEIYMAAKDANLIE